MWRRLRKIVTGSSVRREIKIAPHERPLARVLAEAGDPKVEAIIDLEVARSITNAYLIMEGDWGGQVYLTIPVSLIRCRAEDIELLLRELDSMAWGCNGGEGCGAYFERHETGDGIPGGMGGGVAKGSLWIHPELVSAGAEQRARDVLLEAGRT